MGMGSHQSTTSIKDEWLTPPEILHALGPFDLDPCAPPDRPWATAKRYFTVADDGLRMPWTGRVWLNPPYGRQAAEWLEKLSDHGNGIVLIFARTETKMFFDHVWSKADAVLFLEGRLHFHHSDGRRATANAGAPSVLIAYGKTNAVALENSGIPGQFLRLDNALKRLPRPNRFNEFDQLEHQFLQLWQRMGLKGNYGPWYDQILRMYTQSTRHYHGIQHIAYCLDRFNEYRHTQTEHDIYYFNEVEMAIWLHDVIYDPQGLHNELDSAIWAAQMLRVTGADSTVVTSVFNIIMATLHRQPPTHPAHMLMVDIDLSALGDTYVSFCRDSQNIQQEYSWVPEDVYLTNRARVLKRFLERDKIYSTPFFAARESQARSNLQKALQLLEDHHGI